MKKQFSYDRILLFAYFFILAAAGTFLLSLPLASCGEPFRTVDALFLAVSACCVTGLSPVPMHSLSVFGFTVIALLIEFGGLGFITFFSLYIYMPRQRVSLVGRRMIRSLFIAEIESEPRKILGTIIAATLTVQIAGTVLLYFSCRNISGIEYPFAAAAFHAVSAFCNAGFSVFDDSLACFSGSPAAILTASALIILGGLGFIVYNDIYVTAKNRRRRHLSFHSKTVLAMTAILTVAGTLIILLLEYNNAFGTLSLSGKVTAAFFQAVTTRTAGFEIIPQADFSPATTIVTVLYMFIGGSPGSMAGGIKTTTFCIVLLYCLSARDSSSNMLLGKRRINGSIIEKAFTIMGRYLFMMVLCLFFLTLTESESLKSGAFHMPDLIFETVSAFATTGLSRGITALISMPGKLLLSAAMVIGRTGAFAMLISRPDFSGLQDTNYTEEQVMLG